MKNHSEIAVLIAQAENTLNIMEQNFQFYSSFKLDDYKKLGKTTSAAMVLSQIFTDYFTCVETFFFRTSQLFENSLESSSWHKSLLDKMTLDIKGIRPAVISRETFLLLDELLRFRHFRRYYFNFDYDWDKLELIEKKYLQVNPKLNNELRIFTEFLEQLTSE